MLRENKNSKMNVQMGRVACEAMWWNDILLWKSKWLFVSFSTSAMPFQPTFRMLIVPLIFTMRKKQHCLSEPFELALSLFKMPIHGTTRKWLWKNVQYRLVRRLKTLDSTNMNAIQRSIQSDKFIFSDVFWMGHLKIVNRVIELNSWLLFALRAFWLNFQFSTRGTIDCPAKTEH